MFFKTLSGRFLLLSFIFVMIAEVLLFVPSVSNFRLGYLQDRLELAQLASLALLATPDDMVAPELADELLKNAEVLNIVLRRDAVRELVLAMPMSKPISQTFDLRDAGFFGPIKDAFVCAFGTPGNVIRIIGQPVKDAGIQIEIVMNEAPVKSAMLEYGRNVFFLSLVVSLITGGLLFLSLQALITRPITKVISSMTRFRTNPEDASNVIKPDASISELREAETALHDMQLQLIASLRQRERLAALGGAVSKVSHDLRNILTTTQILADRLEMSDDPKVQKMAPKLLNSLSRGINLCERTLTFGKADEPEPEIRSVGLKAIVDDVIDNDALRETKKVQLISTVAHDMQVSADPEQMFRVLTNLVRNARQAIEGTGKLGIVSISADMRDGGVDIIVRDTGPGLPEKAREFLFQPFQGGARRGGTGLGLAIAAELVRGHGGILELIETSEAGTSFRIYLPDAEK
ncbi:sensor histidine kinase [Rhodobacterales bacterium 52_120_T64]|nr:sensor histidine kinase [Rhodobacterales bacterium 52_120_T64]